MDPLNDSRNEEETVKLALIKCGRRGWKVVLADGEIRFFVSLVAAIRAHAHEAGFCEAEVSGLFGDADEVICVA